MRQSRLFCADYQTLNRIVRRGDFFLQALWSPASLISGWPKKDVTEKPQQTFWRTQYCVCICAKLLQLCLALCNPTSRLCCPWGFSRQEYWSGLLCPHPDDLPNLGIEPTSYFSYIGRRVPYHKCHLGSPSYCIFSNEESQSFQRQFGGIKFVFFFLQLKNEDKTC